jgi:hypothetical protein
VSQPAAVPTLGQPLALTISRPGSEQPLFDTTGHK